MYNQKSTYIQSPAIRQSRAEVGLEVALQRHLLLDEVGCWGGVNSIGQVVRVNNDGVFADQVQSETKGVDIAFRDVGEWSALEGIAKDHLSHQFNLFVHET